MEMIHRPHKWLLLILLLSIAFAEHILPNPQVPMTYDSLLKKNHEISADLFADLEELSRIVDIAYCVGWTGTGIQKPFLCASRCQEFKSFQLVTTWNTGLFLFDSCGYIAISHPPSVPRIIIAFRGTYSITNTVIDLSTFPQKYVPYPGGDNDNDGSTKKCTGCTVHAGFIASWRQTRPNILPYLEELMKIYPDYQLTLVGHSLGGAVAALASLEFHAQGWEPQVTTYGEPRIGNFELMQYIDRAFAPDTKANTTNMYRRVTHANDPVPLLPLSEWGYSMHAGEIYISKKDLPPSIADIRHCEGDQDPKCIAGLEPSITHQLIHETNIEVDDMKFLRLWNYGKGILNVPKRFRMWQLFLAHRDYFWRLGLCVPGGDPTNGIRNTRGSENDFLDN